MHYPQKTPHPMATPAIGEETGIPASIIAKLPPHTLAMLLDPQLSVMRLSTRMVYGNSFYRQKQRSGTKTKRKALRGVGTAESLLYSSTYYIAPLIHP